MNTMFDSEIAIINDALKSIDDKQMKKIIDDCENALRAGKKIIASGLGKNVPICEKFEGTMLSLGLNANFLHTNSAAHGDIGMVKDGDVVIVLSKSGTTEETVYLVNLLKKRDGVKWWIISFNAFAPLVKSTANNLVVNLEHEGDLWNIVPNNSTTINLIILQKIAIELSKRLGLELETDFKPNHPGGAIGKRLENG
ncbi:MAG: SIS domain-containing protein [Clostridia bacterium]|nr:SIS domain-containing protein [Clostridia bacterium]